MRVRTVTALAALVLFASSAASAQERSSVGLGIGITTFSFTAPTIYVPIQASDQIVIEPLVALFREKETVGDNDEIETEFTIGASVLWLFGQTTDNRLYVGPRVAIGRESFSAGNNDESLTHLFLGVVTGGEHFLVPRFSLGGEVGLIYANYGQTELEEELDIDESEIFTTAEFRVRWYLP